MKENDVKYDIVYKHNIFLEQQQQQKDIIVLQEAFEFYFKGLCVLCMLV